MSKTIRIGIITVAVIFAFGGCSWFGSRANDEEAAVVLAQVSHGIWTATGVPMNSVVPRAAAPLPITSPDGGTATFTRTLVDGTLTGNVVFDGYTVTDSDENVFVLDGDITLTLTLYTLESTGFTATMVGDLTISKNGGEPKVYDADVVHVISYTVGADGITLVITTTGTVNDTDVSGERTIVIAVTVIAT